jgi:hypothetical protein
MDRGRLNKKIWLCLLASPITLLPFVGGVTGLLATWVFGLGVKAAFISFTPILVGLGILTTRVITGADKVTSQAIQELERENAEARQKFLQELQAELEEDDDPRTTDLLVTLIDICKSFSEGNTIASRINPTSAFEIASGVERLHDECISLLQRSLLLYQTARKIRDRSAKKTLLDDREKIIKEVQQSIRQLSKLLASIYTLDLRDDSTSEVSRIRLELEQNLNIARRVEETMGSNPTAVRVRQ